MSLRLARPTGSDGLVEVRVPQRAVPSVRKETSERLVAVLDAGKQAPPVAMAVRAAAPRPSTSSAGTAASEHHGEGTIGDG